MQSPYGTSVSVVISSHILSSLFTLSFTSSVNNFMTNNSSSFRIVD